MNDTLLIGVGNTLRRDDGAGIHAAEQCAERYPSIDCMTAHQLQPEIAETVSRYARVIFIDASITADDLTVSEVAAGDGMPGSSAHALSPSELLSLCSSLYEKTPDRAILIEIPAKSTDFGEILSDSTTEMIARAVDLVREESAAFA